MPTIFTHPAVPLAIGLGLGQSVIPGRLLFFGIVASVLPDLDVLAFKFGIPYASVIGHRGLTHSILFALVLAALGLFAYRTFRASRLKTFAFLFVVTISHAILDAFTNGGLGVALLWPLSTERFFAPWRVIQVSPIGAHFFSARGSKVILSELFWVWLPCVMLYAGLLFARRTLTTHSSGTPSGAS
jgi:inner membrane protein